MTVPILGAEHRWECPNCTQTAVTCRNDVHTEFHYCRGLVGMWAPMVEAGVRCKVEAHERDDYVNGDLVQTNGEGRPIMSVVTTRENGQDCAVYGAHRERSTRVNANPSRGMAAPETKEPLVAWTNSKIFSAWITDSLNKTNWATGGAGLDADTIKAALYDNDITPSQSVTSANSAYNADQWVTTNNEVFDAAEWTQGGMALATVTSTFSSNVYTFDAADRASGTSATLANVTGVHVYDDTLTAPVADQGICYNYLGGATNGVIDGTFTVVWNPSGIFALTL